MVGSWRPVRKQRGIEHCFFVHKWYWWGRRVERQWRTQKQKLVWVWQCMEGHGPTLQLCFFVYYCKREMDVFGAEEKGGKDCFADMMRGLKRWLLRASFSLGTNTDLPSVKCRHQHHHANFTSITWSTTLYVATYLPPTATLLP